MPRAIWTGAITFGLVHIPVRLVAAVKDTAPEFHMLDSKTGQRIHYQTVNEDGQEVERDQIVKGQEVESGEYVAVEPDFSVPWPLRSRPALRSMRSWISPGSTRSTMTSPTT